MARLLRRTITFAAVNAFLVCVWLLTTGSVAKLQAVLTDPTRALSLGFWPVWPILACGTLLVIEAANALTGSGRHRAASKRNRRDAKRAAEHRRAKFADIAATGSGIVADVAAAGAGLVREVGDAVDGAKRRGTDRTAEPAAVEQGPQRRWVTVLFTDISDSTAHNEAMGDDEWHRVIGRVRSVVRSALASRGGTEVGTQGDGMLARFGSPADAVMCAIDIQSELDSARQGDEFIPGVRIGVHTGEAVHDDGDLIGRVINLASRVMDEAQPGEIMVTEPVADQLVGKLELVDKGLRPLKGVSQPRHLLAVRWSQD